MGFHGPHGVYMAQQTTRWCRHVPNGMPWGTMVSPVIPWDIFVRVLTMGFAPGPTEGGALRLPLQARARCARHGRQRSGKYKFSTAPLSIIVLELPNCRLIAMAHLSFSCVCNNKPAAAG